MTQDTPPNTAASRDVEVTRLTETMRRVEYDMLHRRMIPSDGFVGERKEVAAIITALRTRLSQPQSSDVESIITAVVEEAEQACRYMGKHNVDSQSGEYRDGFQTACEILGTSDAIASHVARHKDRILAALPNPDAPPQADSEDQARVEVTQADINLVDKLHWEELSRGGSLGEIRARIAVRYARLASLPESAGDAVQCAALRQNDEMRCELAHVGNLVSDLARAMGVDQANDDGSWPDLSGRISRLIALAPPQADSTDAVRRAALEEALATRDRAVSVCPDKALNPAKPCRVCSATSDEPCRKRVIADAKFVDAARVALAAGETA